MLSIVKSAALRGIDAVEISIEIDAANGGLPGEALVGLPDTVVRESKNRIKAAIKNSGFKYPLKFYTINLAPADLPKEGAFFDVPIAIGILQATEQLPVIESTLYVGELSLNGDVRPIRGIISICHMAAMSGYTHIVIPAENEPEARLIPNITIIPVQSLADIRSFLHGEYIPHPIENTIHITPSVFADDFSDVQGQVMAKRVLEIAASGHHNVLLIGSPGSGKSMLLKRLVSILPDLTMDQAIETFKIHSISTKGGLPHAFTLTPPFRQPHHSISYAGLVGGGSNPLPGEISRAHHGILFLDELPEFPRQVIEVLRQPLEDKTITISRSQASINYPADCLFISAMNPCPCGYYGDTKTACMCNDTQIKKYWKKISGPILDRIDLIITVPRLEKDDFYTVEVSTDYHSSTIRGRVITTQQRQLRREKNLNGNLTPSQVKKHCAIDSDAQQLLGVLIEKGVLTGRSYTKLLKVARTIADMSESESIEVGHVSEAIHYRKAGVYT